MTLKHFAENILNRLLQPRLLAALSLLCLFACGSSHAQIHLTPSPSSRTISLSVGPQRALPQNYLGYNIDMAAYQVDWHSKSFLDAIDGLSPGTLRFPGGSFSNLYDWKTGYFSAQAPGNYKWAMKRAPFGLHDLSQAVQSSKAKPIFVLNMLTSTLGDQLAMLKQAQEMGLPVDYIELGNEFYFSTPENLAIFPTGQSYGRAASAWANALHDQFPNAKVAALGCYAPWPLFIDHRRGYWDRDVLQTLKGADAITLHYYVDTQKILSAWGGDITSESIPLLLGAPFDNLPGLKKVVSEIPPALPIWVTEFNVMDATWRKQKPPIFGPLPGTWAQGLMVATMTFQFLEIPQIRRLDFHALADARPFGAIYTGDPTAPYPLATRYAYSASGQVLRLFGKSLTGALYYQRIQFSNAPTINGVKGNYPGLLGGLFSKPNSKSLLIENLSPESVLINPASLVGNAYKVDQAWANPSDRILNAASLKILHLSAQGSLKLPPYSVTLIE